MEKEKMHKVVPIDTCGNCGRNLKEGWRFCPYCKTQVETCKCNCCGKEIKPSWNFCPRCGDEITMEYKNKQRVDKCNEWLRDILNKQ